MSLGEGGKFRSVCCKIGNTLPKALKQNLCIAHSMSNNSKDILAGLSARVISAAWALMVQFHLRVMTLVDKKG